MDKMSIGPVRVGREGAGSAFRFMNGNFLVRVSTEASGGKLSVYDTERTNRGGPPRHFHLEQDEWFQVVEGVFDFEVDGIEYRLNPGDSILGPSGKTHAFTNVSEYGRLLLVFAPAGQMDAFFRLISELEDVSPEMFAEISADHGMVVNGQPLPVRTQ